ncbi:MAG: patatin-like phospholipase family protein [Candidatus Omnitrophica bacterium]|nr:patatin-like phospholipase family protein [Candidatus Omnitrophota bacterium]
MEQLALKFKNLWDIRQIFILDLGIPVFSFIIGCAAGALVGWLAHSIWTGIMFGFVLCLGIGVTFGPLVGGPIQGARLMKKFQDDFEGKSFADTWLPLKVIAANPMAREEVVFDSGPLADAVRASVSIPGIFKPVVRRGKICLDGGVVNPVPVSVLKRAGAHRVIAVNVFPTTPELIASQHDMQRRKADRDAALASRSLPIRLLVRLRQELVRSVSPLIFDVIMRSMQFMEHQIAEICCRDADITLRPTLPGSHWLEFYNPEKFINRGEEVALQYLPELKRITRMRSVDNNYQPQ